MPQTWYSVSAIDKVESDYDRRFFYVSICANRKPYFMTYIYPALMSDYKDYVSNCERSSRRRFGYSISDISSMPDDQTTPEMKIRLDKYDERMPVGTNDCSINIICRRFEEEFDDFLKRLKERPGFDYTILKAGIDYPESLYYSLLQLYKDYNQTLADYNIYASEKKYDKARKDSDRAVLKREFRRNCLLLCSNEYELTDILLDMCYTRDSSKRFVWDMCAGVIIENLLNHNERVMSIPVLDAHGDIDYAGDRFKIVTKRVE